MNSNQLKNIVILKDLPSNLIEEAFIVLKSNKKIKSLERVDKNSNIKENKTRQEECIVKEAEMVIGNYLSKIEKEKQFKSYAMKQIELKYKRLKLITIALGSFFIINLILNIV